MIVHTEPREISARWLRPYDEIATFTDAEGKLHLVHTLDFLVKGFEPVEWVHVADGARLVPPPDDPTIGRVQGFIRHKAGGAWSIDRMQHRMPPDGMDHVGTVELAVMAVVDDRRRPRVLYIRDRQQLVMRERLTIDARPDLRPVAAPAPVAAPEDPDEPGPELIAPPGARRLRESAAVDHRSARDSEDVNL